MPDNTVTYTDNFLDMRVRLSTLGEQAEIGGLSIDKRRSYTDGGSRVMTQDIAVIDGPDGTTDEAFEYLVNMLTDRHALALAAASAKVVAARGL